MHRTWNDIMHVKYAKVLYLSKESILQGTHAWPDWFARTSKNKIADMMRTWDDIMHKVHKRYCIYQRNLYFRELTRWPNWFARTSKREYQIHAYMRWYYAWKVRKGTVFIKGIYISANSRMAGLVRPNIQKKIADMCVHELILCM